MDPDLEGFTVADGYLSDDELRAMNARMDDLLDGANLAEAADLQGTTHSIRCSCTCARVPTTLLQPCFYFSCALLNVVTFFSFLLLLHCLCIASMWYTVELCNVQCIYVWCTLYLCFQSWC